jgi:hypothetical protein
MMSRRPAATFAALALLTGGACTADAPPQLAPDPEVAARALLAREVVFAPPETLRPRFLSAVSPADFPLRLIVDDAAGYTFVDLWRIRMIDSRAIVTALVKLNDETMAFELWLESHDGVWQVAGWDQVPRTVDPDAPLPASVRLPGPLAGATFRTSLNAPALPIPEATAAAPEEAPGGARRARVTIGRTQLDGTCPRRALETAVRERRGRLAACYAARVSGEDGRRGRLTVGFSTANGRLEAPPRVLESTLLLDGLADCVSEALADIRPPAEARCTARFRLNFAPR